MRFSIEVPDSDVTGHDPDELARALQEVINSHVLIAGEKVEVAHVELATDDEVAAAVQAHVCDEIEIDAPAAVSRADEGYWVQAWVWVESEE